LSNLNIIDYNYNNPVIAQGSTGAGSKNTATLDSIEKRINVLMSGIDHGIKIIDTAPSYEGGHSEEIVGKVLQQINRDEIILCTKFEPDSNSYNGVLRSIDESLDRLKTHYIDIYQVHWPNPEIPISETMGALSELVDRGKIKNIGVCNFTKREILEAEEYLDNKKIVSAQAEYNLNNRMAEDNLFEFCKRTKKLFFAYNLFNQGRMMQNNLIISLAKKYGVREHQVIINWSITNNFVIPILNSMSIGHTIQNVNAINFKLSSEDIDLINKEFKDQTKLIDSNDIQVVDFDVDDTHKIYTNINDAIENKFRMSPSPVSLSKEIKKGKLLKPVELIFNRESEKPKYILVHGRIRYWAWLIAFNGEKPIPAHIIDID